MNNSTIIATGAITLGSFLSGCNANPGTELTFKNQLIKIGQVDGAELRSVQWLNYNDSTIVAKTTGSNNPGPGVHGGYYIADGVITTTTGYFPAPEDAGFKSTNKEIHTVSNSIKFTNCKEITKEKADSLRTTVTFQEAIAITSAVKQTAGKSK